MIKPQTYAEGLKIKKYWHDLALKDVARMARYMRVEIWNDPSKNPRRDD